MYKKLVWFGVLASLSGAPAFADEGEWVIGPAWEDDWSADFTLALTANYMDPEIVDGDTGLGLQLSLNCPWFQPPSGIIRQQFNLNKFEKGGIKLTTFELNPHYYVEVTPSVWLGYGPGFGYMWTDLDEGDSSRMWTFQFSGDIEYRQGALFLGAGARYQITQDKEIVPSDDKGVDNLLVQLKAGVNF